MNSRDSATLRPTTPKLMYVFAGLNRRHSHVPARDPNSSSIPHKLTSSNRQSCDRKSVHEGTYVFRKTIYNLGRAWNGFGDRELRHAVPPIDLLHSQVSFQLGRLVPELYPWYWPWTLINTLPKTTVSFQLRSRTPRHD
jgi:hypothetical protein